MRGGGEPPRQILNATGAMPRPGRRARPKAETKGGVRGGGEPPRQILYSAHRQGFSVPQRHRTLLPRDTGLCCPQTQVFVAQRHRVSVPLRHTVSVSQRHRVSAPDRPAKKIDFRIETSGVRDETWWKFRAMPGEFLRQNQQTWPSASPSSLPSFRSSPPGEKPRGGDQGIGKWKSEVRGGVWTV